MGKVWGRRFLWPSAPCEEQTSGITGAWGCLAWQPGLALPRAMPALRPCCQYILFSFRHPLIPQVENKTERSFFALIPGFSAHGPKQNCFHYFFSSLLNVSSLQELKGLHKPGFHLCLTACGCLAEMLFQMGRRSNVSLAASLMEISEHICYSYMALANIGPFHNLLWFQQSLKANIPTDTMLSLWVPSQQVQYFLWVRVLD